MDIGEREKVIRGLEEKFVKCLERIIDIQALETHEFASDFKNLIEFCRADWDKISQYIDDSREHGQEEFKNSKTKTALGIYDKFIRRRVETTTDWEIEKILLFAKVVERGSKK